jgi:hypothetical protein
LSGNIDKHRLIITVGSACNSVDVAATMTASTRALPGGIAIPDMSFFLRPADRLFPLEAGKELLIGPPNEEPNENVQLSFDIAVQELGFIEGEPIIAYAIPRSYEGRRGVLQTVSLLRQKRRASFRHQTRSVRGEV